MAHQRRGYAGFAAWARRSSTFYSLGLLTLMLGVACIVIPAAGTALDPWRWATLLVVLGMFLFEIFWVYAGRVQRSRPRILSALGLGTLHQRWFHPVTHHERRKAAR